MTSEALRQVLSATGYMADGEAAPGVLLGDEARLGRRGRSFTPDALWRGHSIGGSIPVETAVLAEFTPARVRSRAIAIWAMALPLGAFVAPLCVAALPTAFGWRGLLVIGGIPIPSRVGVVA